MSKVSNGGKVPRMESTTLSLQMVHSRFAQLLRERIIFDDWRMMKETLGLTKHRWTRIQKDASEATRAELHYLAGVMGLNFDELPAAIAAMPEPPRLENHQLLFKVWEDDYNQNLRATLSAHQMINLVDILNEGAAIANEADLTTTMLNKALRDRSRFSERQMDILNRLIVSCSPAKEREVL